MQLNWLIWYSPTICRSIRVTFRKISTGCHTSTCSTPRSMENRELSTVKRCLKDLLSSEGSTFTVTAKQLGRSEKLQKRIGKSFYFLALPQRPARRSPTRSPCWTSERDAKLFCRRSACRWDCSGSGSPSLLALLDLKKKNIEKSAFG